MRDKIYAWAILIEYKRYVNGSEFRWVRPEEDEGGKNFFTTVNLVRANKFDSKKKAEQYATGITMMNPDMIGKVKVVKINATWPDAHGIGLHGGWEVVK